MTNKLAAAAVEGFKNPFRLTFAIVAAIVSVVVAFVVHTPQQEADSKYADHKNRG